MGLLAKLGLGAVTSVGWYVLAAVFIAMLTAIGGLTYLNSSLRDDLKQSGVANGILQAAKASNEATIAALRTANEALKAAAEKCSASLTAYQLDMNERVRAAEQAVRDAATQGAEDKRIAAVIEAARQRKQEHLQSGDPQCVAAVRIIRGAMQ